jgi:hypothetical protein
MREIVTGAVADYFKILGLSDGRMILKWILEKWNVGTDWIDLAEDKERWRVFVNSVMNLEVPQNAGYFLRS